MKGLLFIFCCVAASNVTLYEVLPWEKGKDEFEKCSLHRSHPTNRCSLSVHTSAIVLSNAPTIEWNAYNKFSTLAERTKQQAMALQVDLLRTHVIQWMYACTTTWLRVPFPPYATRDAIRTIRDELVEQGYPTRVSMHGGAFLIKVPLPI
jgi:hypothetical protein